jgi:hypothetical protein
VACPSPDRQPHTAPERYRGTGSSFVGAEVPILCGDREFFVDLLFYHRRPHRNVVFEWKLGRFEPEHIGKLSFHVQLVDDHLRDQARDDPTLNMLQVVGRDDVTVKVALLRVSTPLAVTEWRRLPAKVRQATPPPKTSGPPVTRTVREIESTTPVALGRPVRDAARSSLVLSELVAQQVQFASGASLPRVTGSAIRQFRTRPFGYLLQGLGVGAIKYRLGHLQ